MPTDYINPTDGLLYCGKCNTRKQCKVKVFGAERVQYCTCRCEQERLVEEKAERERQQAIADTKRRETINRAKVSVNLLVKLDNGTSGYIEGEILSRR